MSPLFYAVGNSGFILRCKITNNFSYMQEKSEIFDFRGLEIRGLED